MDDLLYSICLVITLQRRGGCSLGLCGLVMFKKKKRKFGFSYIQGVCKELSFELVVSLIVFVLDLSVLRNCLEAVWKILVFPGTFVVARLGRVWQSYNLCLAFFNVAVFYLYRICR